MASSTQRAQIFSSNAHRWACTGVIWAFDQQFASQRGGWFALFERRTASTCHMGLGTSNFSLWNTSLIYIWIRLWTSRPCEWPNEHNNNPFRGFPGPVRPENPETDWDDTPGPPRRVIPVRFPYQLPVDQALLHSTVQLRHFRAKRHDNMSLIDVYL